MSGLVEFLNERIDEEAAVAERASRDGFPHWEAREMVRWEWELDSDPCPMSAEERQNVATFDPARVLADCTARRKIIDLADEATGLDMQVDSEFRVGFRDEKAEPYIGELMLRALALPYADHADFDASWGGSGG